MQEWNGFDTLHGAEVHGYPNEGDSGATDFVNYYRMWMRGQVAELDGMHHGLNWPSIPAPGDLYVGVFKTLRVFTGKP